MTTDQNVERMYELLEQFDFDELSAQDKKYVLSILTEAEYVNMRGTLKDTKNFFIHAEEPSLEDSLYESLIDKRGIKNVIIRLLKQPIQLYKIAATIVILSGIYFIIHYFNPIEKGNELAFCDTIYVHRTDTVYSKIADTVRVIKEKIVFVSSSKELAMSSQVLPDSAGDSDCKKNICPHDIDEINSLTQSNQFSKDILLTSFIVSIN
jgi:hypothetical protein